MSYGNVLSGEAIDSLDDISESLQSPNKFVNEIVWSDIELLQTVGRGAFGVVQKARWKDDIVAIKIIDNGGKEFFDEVSNLSSVEHKNIIKLFGTTYDKPKLCLVMEYAECGSLYNLLHPTPSQQVIPYTFAHVMSWSLQCAEAVNYLHKMKPRGIVHRDLKPPNMLLTDYGTIIKIGDFGTATAYHTEMTSNRGSAAWMAPEVFEGTNYSEKCDVYSFGIVLWEMLTRRKPFDEIGAPAFRIMWAVHSGKRPPPIQDIPACLECLMTSCWAKEESHRPPFEKIVEFFQIANQYVEGGDEPLFEIVDPDFVESGDDGSFEYSQSQNTSIERNLEDVVNRARERLQSNDGNKNVDPLLFQKAAVTSQVNNTTPLLPPQLQPTSLLKTVTPDGHQQHQYMGDHHATSQRTSPSTHIHERSHSDLDQQNMYVPSIPPVQGDNTGYRQSYIPPYTPSSGGSSYGDMTPMCYQNDREIPPLPQYTMTPPPKLPQHSPLYTSGGLLTHSRELKPGENFMPPVSPGYLGIRSPGSQQSSSTHTTPSPILEHFQSRRTSGPGHGETIPRHSDATNKSPIPMDKPMNSDIDFRLVPQELMPVNPIETVPNSVQMYENHMESLKQYIDLQNKIQSMKKKKANIERNIEEVDKEQKRNSRYLEDYLHLQNEKQSLLDLHRKIKTHLEKEKQRRAGMALVTS